MIRKIEISNLFGYFNHSICLENLHDNVLILHGPNGSGKSTILKMLNSLSIPDFDIFYRVPFDNIKIELDNSILYLSKDENDNITITCSLDSCEPYVLYAPKTDDGELISSSDRENKHRYLQRHGGFRISANKYEYENKVYEFDELYNLLNGIKFSQQPPLWFSSIVDSINVLYIGAERLFSNNLHKVLEDRKTLIETISTYESQYAVVSRQLDASFPSRVINLNKSLSNQIVLELQIVNDLHRLSSKTNEINKRGILSSKSTDELINQINVSDVSANNTVKQFLSLYINDNYKKFEVLDDLMKRITLFEKLINSVFEGKNLTINKSTGYSVVSNRGKYNGKVIQPNMLSSGEQHFLVMFFELVFNAKTNQLILVDEPELSLHISWQIDMVDRLIEIARMNDINFLLATHSPSIIRNHMDKTIAMGYEESDEINSESNSSCNDEYIFDESIFDHEVNVNE